MYENNLTLFLLIRTRFIEHFGTHVIVGVSMGGKDVLYVRQHEDTSDINDPASIQKLLKETASMKFKDSADNHLSASEDLSNKKKVMDHIFLMTFQCF